MCVECVNCVLRPNVFLKTTTSHTLRWPATPWSIREAGTQVVSTQNVGVFAEKLNRLYSHCCVRRRSMIAVEQFGWRCTTDSACLVFMSNLERAKTQREKLNIMHHDALYTGEMKDMWWKCTFYTCRSCATPHAISLTGPLLGASENERWMAPIVYSYKLLLEAVDGQQISIRRFLWRCTCRFPTGWNCGNILINDW